MLKNLSQTCARFPIIVILLITLITGAAVHQIVSHLYFEGDLSKFLPKDLTTVKADDYYQKNFNYQESMIIGLEAKQGTLMEAETLRKFKQELREEGSA